MRMRACGGRSTLATFTHLGLGGTKRLQAFSRVCFSSVVVFWNVGEYNTPWVRIYVTLEGVGQHKEGVNCEFTRDSFDLKIQNVGGTNYRLFKDKLAHEIVVEESKVVVKRDRLVVKLRKKPTTYGGFDHWSELVAKRSKKTMDKDPSTGIMDLMRDMYNDGDDNMKKVIGEAMMKAQSNPGDRGLPQDL
mmetsp:Transcript_3544/g.13968  ORF Transcript_3544/g.13968 Transcript_3544/m.13968 type:complete len:190 (+) Transcript_3544:420-989(+)